MNKKGFTQLLPPIVLLFSILSIVTINRILHNSMLKEHILLKQSEKNREFVSSINKQFFEPVEKSLFMFLSNEKIISAIENKNFSAESIKATLSILDELNDTEEILLVNSDAVVISSSKDSSQYKNNFPSTIASRLSKNKSFFIPSFDKYLNKRVFYVGGKIESKKSDIFVVFIYNTSIIDSLFESLDINGMLLTEDGIVFSSSEPTFLYCFFHSYIDDNQLNEQNSLFNGKLLKELPFERDDTENIIVIDKNVYKFMSYPFPGIFSSGWELISLTENNKKEWLPINKKRTLNYATAAISIAIFLIVLSIFFLNRVNTSERLIQKQDEDIKKYDEELLAFTTAISESMRKPLDIIIRYIKLLMKNDDSVNEEEVDKKMLEAIDEALYIGIVLDNIVQYANISNLDNSVSTVNLNWIIKTVLQQLGRQIDESGAFINVEEMPEVIGYENQLMRYFFHIMDNAIKFKSPIRPLAINVSAKNYRSFIRISVTDNGQGIDRSDLNKIFNIFTRLKNAENIAGHGIGLAICRKIAEEHRGKIGVNSTLGVGSTFYIDLPI